MCFYAFPPFCIYINQVLQKISEEKATGIIVIPHWPTPSWWPYLTNMLINCPLMLPSTQTTLMLPSHPQKIHPLQKRLRLLMRHLSGDYLKVKPGISKEVASIIVQAWRPGTQKQYRYYLQKWEQHYCERSTNPHFSKYRDCN
jgi:hypothetical protein